MPKKEDEYKKVGLFPPPLWMVMLLMPERTFAKCKELYFGQIMSAFGHHGFRWPMVVDSIGNCSWRIPILLRLGHFLLSESREGGREEEEEATDWTKGGREEEKGEGNPFQLLPRKKDVIVASFLPLPQGEWEMQGWEERRGSPTQSGFEGKVENSIGLKAKGGGGGGRRNGKVCST